MGSPVLIGRTVLAWLASCLVAGCAHVVSPTQKPQLPALFADDSYRQAGPWPDATQALTLSEPMREYLQTQLLPNVLPNRPLGVLIETLVHAGRLRLAYDSAQTLTAAQAFAAQRGNCLSLVLMTAAFAEGLGLQVEFQQVDDAIDWEQRAGLTFILGHVNLKIARDRVQERTRGGTWHTDWLVVDFLPGQDLRHQVATPISRQRVLAMYLNNRGAEELAAGRIDAAYGLLRSALVQDSSFAAAFNNLAVVHLRKGLHAKAEASWRAALALDAHHTDAAANLADWLAKAGRSAEAEQLLSAQTERSS